MPRKYKLLARVDEHGSGHFKPFSYEDVQSSPLYLYDPFQVLAPFLTEFGGSKLSVVDWATNKPEFFRLDWLPEIHTLGSDDHIIRRIYRAVGGCDMNDFFIHLMARLLSGCERFKFQGIDAYPWVIALDLCIGILLRFKNQPRALTYHELYRRFLSVSPSIPFAEGIRPTYTWLVINSIPSFLFPRTGPVKLSEPLLTFLFRSLAVAMPQSYQVKTAVREVQKRERAAFDAVKDFGVLKEMALSSRVRLPRLGCAPDQDEEELKGEARLGKVKNILRSRNTIRRARALSQVRHGPSDPQDKILKTFTNSGSWSLLWQISKLGNYPCSEARCNNFEARVGILATKRTSLRVEEIQEYALRQVFREFIYYVFHWRLRIQLRTNLVFKAVHNLYPTEILASAGKTFRTQTEVPTRSPDRLLKRGHPSPMMWFKHILINASRVSTKSDTSACSMGDCRECGALHEEDDEEDRGNAQLKKTGHDNAQLHPYFTGMEKQLGFSVRYNGLLQMLVFGLCFKHLGVSKGCIRRLLEVLMAIHTRTTPYNGKSGQKFSTNSISAVSRFIKCKRALRALVTVCGSFSSWLSIRCIRLPRDIAAYTVQALSSQFELSPEHLMDLFPFEALVCPVCLRMCTVHVKCGPSAEGNGSKSTNSARRIAGHLTITDPSSGVVTCGYKSKRKEHFCRYRALVPVDLREGAIVQAAESYYGFCPQPGCGSFAELSPTYGARKWNKFGWSCRICAYE